MAVGQKMEMCNRQWNMSVIVCSFLLMITGSHAFTCYSCSYTDTGTKVGFECVEDPANVQQAHTVACSLPMQCTTRTVYRPGYASIQSMNRGCMDPQPIQCGVECCYVTTYDTTCQTVCQSDFCNSQNVTKSPTSNTVGNSQQRIMGHLLLLSLSSLAVGMYHMYG